MAKGLNRVCLMGNLGKSAEIRATGGGTTVATFSLATAEREKVNGEWKDRTEWHNCVAFGRLAEIVRDYTSKGSRLYLEGRLQTRSWEKDGKKQYRTEVVLSDVILSGGKSASRRDDDGFDMHPSVQPVDITDDDVPF